MGGCLLGLALLLASAADPSAGELLYVSEGNRLRRLDLDTLGGSSPPLQDVLIENATMGGDAGRDVNGTVCALPDGSGRFVAGEDSDQPHPPAGWGVFERDGTQVGKLVPTAAAKQPEPYGCAVSPDGQLFTSELGDPGFRRANGQLLLWFPPYDRYPGPPGAFPDTDAVSDNVCKLATDIGTAGGLAVDAAGRVYVASAGRFAIRRFSPPFPTGPDAAGGCGQVDALGSPRADAVQEEVFVRGPATFSGLALAPNGNLYAASVATGRIYEYDLDGNLVRTLLAPARWWPPFATGNPQGLAVDAAGTLYYADLDLVRDGLDVGPGPAGKVWRIRFDAGGEPRAPELLLDGLAFPDGLGVLPGDLEARDSVDLWGADAAPE
jgi:sugar lactone lactonase YvrE